MQLEKTGKEKIKRGNKYKNKFPTLKKVRMAHTLGIF